MNPAEYEVPDSLLYTKEHEWLKETGGTARVGITDYAAKTLNDVVYVTLPKVGESVVQFKTMGTVESIKAVSELYSPVSGVVVGVNQELGMHPELVNKSPYGEGWVIEVKPSNPASELKNLLDAAAYRSHIASLKEG